MHPTSFLELSGPLPAAWRAVTGMVRRARAIEPLWLLRALLAYVPRRTVPFPSGVEPVPALGTVEVRRHVLLRNLTFAAFGLSVLAVSSGFGLVSLFAPGADRLFVVALLGLALAGLAASGFLLQTHSTRSQHSRFLGVLARLSTARRGRLSSPAAWVLDPLVWRYSVGRLVSRRLSPVELEVALALAGEWEGSVGSLLEAVPALVTTSPSR